VVEFVADLAAVEAVYGRPDFSSDLQQIELGMDAAAGGVAQPYL
jgi:hypothetical protein